MSNRHTKPQPGSRPSLGLPATALSSGADGVTRYIGMRDCWLFNEGAGAKAASAVNLHSGVLVNTPTWVPGFFGGRALQFGSSSYVNFGAVNLTQDTTGTVVAWIRPSAVAAFSQIVSTSDAVPNVAIAFGITDTAKLYFQAYQAGSIQDITQCDTTVLSAGTIYHVAVTSNGSAWSFYINGVAQAVSQYSGLGSNSGRWFAFIGGSPFDLHVGGREAGVNSFAGKIDHVRIYNRLLKQSEILQLYQAPFGDFPTTRYVRQAVSGGAPTGTLKTYNGLASASVKTFTGLARASTKTVNGLTP